MKSIIIRKPKFLRSDSVMNTYIGVAASISTIMSRHELTTEEKYDMLNKIGTCLNKAAKAGGFFRTSDFCKWMATQSTT